MTDSDPTRDGSDDAVACANCGDRIETREWHPVTSETGDDGDLRIVPFCDPDCRRQWLAEMGHATR